MTREEAFREAFNACLRAAWPDWYGTPKHPLAYIDWPTQYRVTFRTEEGL